MPSEAAATRLEAERDKARAMLADLGRIPYGAEVITAGLMRLVADGRLADRELVIAGTIAGLVTALTCVTDRIEEQARAALLAEQQAGKRGKPLHLQAVNGGVSATANQLNPQTPRAFHGPAPVPHGGVVTPPPATVPAARASPGDRNRARPGRVNVICGQLTTRSPRNRRPATATGPACPGHAPTGTAYD